MDHDVFLFQPGADLAHFDPGDTAGFADEAAAQASMRHTAEQIAHGQDLLMAHGTYGLVILFQAMDGAGKDATIKHVMSSLDPQGVEVKMFKAPTEKELPHDYLWRTALTLPARGQIGLFNRSYYEQVVADRVHPEQLADQQLPPEVLGDGLWDQRFRQINHFEQYLRENGIHVLKFFLNLSRDEQRSRLLERMDRPDKRWKFERRDLEERQHWDEWMTAYAAALEHTSTDVAPWYVIPADQRWVARAIVASIVEAKLRAFHDDYPRLSADQERELQACRAELEREVQA